MKNQTHDDYLRIVNFSKELFLKKTTDYGTSWRIMRLSSITDQLYIKALRIRSIQEKGTQLIDDDINSEFIGIINYVIIALIQLQLTDNDEMQLSAGKVSALYEIEAQKTLDLLMAKNHDYGEAWRHIRVSSMTDLILMKISRIKQIEDNDGTTLVSEGVDAGYRDMLNYAVFCLIKLDFNYEKNNN